MPPKGKNTAAAASAPAAAAGGARPATKSKKQRESEEFDQLLSKLTAATKASGTEAQARKSREADRKKAQEARHALLLKKKTPQSDFFERLQQQQRQQKIRELLQQLMQPSAFLPKPKTDVHSDSAESCAFAVGVGAMQGWRSAMEDAHVALPDFDGTGNAGLFAVFDGHAGGQTSKRCAAQLAGLVNKHTSAESGEVDFAAAYAELDADVRTSVKDESGATAVTVLVTPKTVTCANVGDSRAVMCRGDGETVTLSHDHKPEVPQERERIEAAGGRVEQNRVNGQLAMSRAIGDFQYKRDAARAPDQQLVISRPDVITVPRKADDQFLVVACDGIFDVLTNEQVVEFVSEQLTASPAPTATEIAAALCRRCLAPVGKDGRPERPDGTDNMTAVVVLFKPAA